MNDISKNQIAAIYTALRSRGLYEQKNELVLQFSDGRTESVSCLTFSEAQQLIKSLNTERKPTPQPNDKMIRSIIAMAREMGIITRRQYAEPDGSMKEKSDYSAFNKWLLESSCVKKSNLNKCSYEELNKLVSQYKAIYMDWLKKYH